MAAPTTATPAIAGSSDADSIIDAVERLSEPQFLHAGDTRKLVVLPEGKRVESLKELWDEYLPKPERITGTATLFDERSFVEHVNEQKQSATRIFANPKFEHPSLTAVYDYHAVVGGTQAPDWQQHRAVWPLLLSKEWKSWTAKSGSAMSHVEFAEFLERHVPDVYWGDQMSDYTKLLIAQLELKLASPSTLIGLSRNLAVNVETRVKHVQTLSSGEVSLVYDEQHRDGEGQPIKVPNAFLIAIPVILGGPTYQILVRLRYRMASQKISWFIDLHRADVVFDAALREICARVAAETGVPVFLGSPEA